MKAEIGATGINTRSPKPSYIIEVIVRAYKGGTKR